MSFPLLVVSDLLGLFGSKNVTLDAHFHVYCVCVSLPCRRTDQTVSPMQALAIGAAARTIAASSVLPISVVKTRYEVRIKAAEITVCMYILN